VKRLLVIAPYFPPIGVVGAKRPLMLARHLPRYGWTPVVLAADPAGEPNDPSLLEAVPPELVVRRVLRAPFGRGRSRGPAGVTGGPGRSVLGWDPGYFTPFDRYLWGAPAAIRAADRLAGQHGVAAVHVCADPWSGLLVGLAVALRRRLPLIVDLRDPWSLQRAKMRLAPPPTRALIRATEARGFRRAARVVLTSDAARDAYRDAYHGRIPAGRFVRIRNAFDPGLFAPGAAELPRRWTVLHFGHFRRLVPAEPLLEGFARFVRAEALPPEACCLLLLGSIPAPERARARALGLDPYLEVHPPVPYRQSLAQLRAAHVLALVTTEAMALTVPAKLYDYFAARRPILAITDQPEPGRLVAGSGAGEVVPPADPDAVAAALVRLRARTAGPGGGEISPAAVQPFSAEAQAQAFAALLDEVVSGSAGAGGA